MSSLNAVEYGMVKDLRVVQKRGDREHANAVFLKLSAMADHSQAVDAQADHLRKISPHPNVHASR
jgi:hypothetical protein